ncbi:uncharacterized protein LOC110105896 [Dendrobium catenatum]|uniref:uncharacterized protein LOC110105896 n=1 Tax=Dendrobium catenatum TaxID=906689 RepID=UPI0009F3A4BF|nr:uncharacterized protein LOC110105896 [Dendrobium catenatum]
MWKRRREYSKVISLICNPKEIRYDGENAVDSIDLDNDTRSQAKEILEARETLGNLDEDSIQLIQIPSGNKFDILNSISEDSSKMDVQEKSKIEAVEEGEIVECLIESQPVAKVEAAPEVLMKINDSIEGKIADLNHGKISVQKTKLAKELRFLGPLNAASRLEKNNPSKRRGGALPHSYQNEFY